MHWLILQGQQHVLLVFYLQPTCMTAAWVPLISHWDMWVTGFWHSQLWFPAFALASSLGQSLGEKWAETNAFRNLKAMATASSAWVNFWIFVSALYPWFQGIVRRIWVLRCTPSPEICPSTACFPHLYTLQGLLTNSHCQTSRGHMRDFPIHESDQAQLEAVLHAMACIPWTETLG